MLPDILPNGQAPCDGGNHQVGAKGRLQSVRILPFGPACFTLLAIFILLRVSTSCLPCEAWGVSGYVCAAPYLALPSSQSNAFIAGAAIPEGARIANRLDFLNFRRERFTTDVRGYRNPPEMAIDKAKALLFGSSFSLGLALNDEDVLSARLNQQLGPVIYNVAITFEPVLRADRMIETSGSVGMKNGWILLEVPNRKPLEFGPPSPRRPLRLIVRQWIQNRRMPAAAPVISLPIRISSPAALMRVATLLNLRLHDDRLLPNPFKDRYSEEQLITGQHVLVFSEDKRFAQNPTGLQGTANALVRLRDELDRHGYHLAVLLVPNAYSVYYPFYRNHPPDDARPAI